MAKKEIFKSTHCSTAGFSWTTAEHSPATRFLFTVHFVDAQVGKMATYRLRYQNERGDKGDWSEEFGAMIS
ncbi:MAG: hypothetical protein HY841_06220 [Bacteroidetes bacterium]|nr:hypothetical protein [Bacteroidota bacterium]